MRYFGVGDIGGAPDAETVDWLEKAAVNQEAAVEIRNTSADQLSRDLTPAERAALPEYTGELTMKTHGVGCYTSQAAMKRFNRENELLADAAERAAVIAESVAGLPYPRERLRDAWVRVLWHQFHDDLTGTSIPQAYAFSWNDELVSANQFAAVLNGSTSAVTAHLDTHSAGIPLVVFNPVAGDRRDPAEATVRFTGPAPAAVRVIDGVTGRDVPSQVLGRQGKEAHILFLADLPPVAFKVFEVLPAVAPARGTGSLAVTPDQLDNARYRVKIDANGDIASIQDKVAGRELLKSPVRLELRDDPSPDKPAWRILWDTVNAPPRGFVAAPVVRVAETGPVRVALEITRRTGESTLVQRIMLTEGGDRVDVETLVDWRSPNTLLKASFPFAAANAKATYDLGLGTIERGNNTPDHYEVPAQKWADLTDASGSFGAAVLNDSKYGWDKPADNVLRLTLLHTPKAKAYPYQIANDLGHHRFVYAIVGHAGDWRAGQVPRRAAALNQPLLSFQATAHRGALGRSVSMLSTDDGNAQVAVRALKKAEDADVIVVRLQEQVRPGGENPRPVHVADSLRAGTQRRRGTRRGAPRCRQRDQRGPRPVPAAVLRGPIANTRRATSRPVGNLSPATTNRWPGCAARHAVQPGRDLSRRQPRGRRLRRSQADARRRVAADIAGARRGAVHVRAERAGCRKRAGPEGPAPVAPEGALQPLAGNRRRGRWRRDRIVHHRRGRGAARNADGDSRLARTGGPVGQHVEGAEAVS